jgi:23S rRNA pseudouridine2605 synthase
MVGGATVTDPARDVDCAEPVTVDGEPVLESPPRVMYALNKPSGVVSTARDPQRRPTVVSLIADSTRLYPVGRLDVDTTGLILLTNDGELAHRLTHPRFEVQRTYRVIVANPPVRERALRALRRGVELEDGRTAPARVRRLAPDTLELALHEGRKRQVKRMCAHVGHPVKRLARIRFGPLALGDLPPGGYRRLSSEEVEALASAATAARRSGISSSSAPATPPGG